MQGVKEKNMAIRLLRKNMNNELFLGRILMLVAAFILGLSLASVIYSFYQYITIADIKVTFTFFEAKICGWFSSTYKVAYTNQQGVRVEKYASIFLIDPYLDYVLLKYKLALTNGIYLALFMLLAIVGILCYLWPAITVIIEDFKYQLLKKSRLTTNSNKPYETNLESSKPKIALQKKDKQSIEYQDL